MLCNRWSKIIKALGLVDGKEMGALITDNGYDENYIIRYGKKG
ncbi:hypothetical protein Cyrtocomes_00589 [Candidatus Cyrtobacter comes]|uniref:Uncharacterized protein n=1 Tax=Candidatus Cyrtobacter comes TaxID=675776 RepID=A0ABU5L7X2_9RICK|nr:hypothetical protein [Candidatus Cyrtobacter comes]